MPQSERARNIRELLTWIDAKSVKGGANMREMYFHCVEDVTLGVTKITARNYVQTLHEIGLIKEKDYRFVITSKGKEWLKAHSL